MRKANKKPHSGGVGVRQNHSLCSFVSEEDAHFCANSTLLSCFKVSNIAVRLSKKDGNENRVAVLLNCHYDSWPTSSGGSDDLISCALMMELIRLLAHQPDSLKHDVIFLFNGAEESSLQGAHGFITQHAWRHVVRAFINLEASGSGGRELLFQAGPSNQWLLNSYLAAAVHPHCSIIGQEIFQSGLFPGDTDFRVFRDYGRVPGLDLAFVQNGYWWHTEFDEARRITLGSLQRAGDNVYATLLYLLQSPYLDNPAEFGDQKNVFFDFLGLILHMQTEAFPFILPILTLTRTNRKEEETSLRNFAEMVGGIFVAAAIVLLILLGLHKSPYNHSDAYPIARRIQLFNLERFSCRHIRYKVFDDRPDVSGTKINLLNKEEGPNRLIYDFLIKDGRPPAVSVSDLQRQKLTFKVTLKVSGVIVLIRVFTYFVQFQHPGEPVKDDDTQLLVGAASHYLYGPNMQSYTIKRILAEIVKKRQYDRAWSISASAWNVDMIYRYF
ncbi:peptidase, M28 family [Ancylostoma duodenale]|uniref:FXNA-like protease n=1 Tax=Ancylostoma duodenale TaxID=51022 RepID=A0A0C2CW75_9BILA|nr:peptidase, M28 family [Ancylostoma duodenale]